MKKLSFLIIMTIIMTIFVGCSEISKGKPHSKDKYPQEFPVNINGVVFSEPPKKVASLSPAVTEILFEIGVGDKVIARSTYCSFPESVSSLPTVGSPAKPDIKAIIALKPDVVLTQSPIAVIDVSELDKNGIKVVVLSQPKSYFDILDNYTIISQIFLGNNKGQDMTTQKMSEFDKLMQQASDLKITDSYVFIVTQELAVATGDTLPSSILSAFGKNVAKDKKDYSMSAAEIVAAAPSRVFISNTVDIKKLSPELQALPAIASGKAITIDYSLFEKPTSRLASVVKDLLSKLGANESSSSDADSSITK